MEDREQIADLFASHFKSVYSSKSSTTAPCIVSGSDVSLSSVSVSLADVFEGLRALDTNKGPGPDCIPPLLLRSCCCTLAPPPPPCTYYLCARCSLGLSPAIGSLARLPLCSKRVMELRSGIIDQYRFLVRYLNFWRNFEKIDGLKLGYLHGRFGVGSRLWVAGGRDLHRLL